MRSKRFESFQKKREGKEAAKEYKETVLAEGKDPDAYLDDAFDDESE